MEIDWSESLAGYTMLQAREALRRLYRGSGGSNFTELAGPGGDPKALQDEMLQRGWLERDEEGRIELTVRGNAVAMAKKLKPITRAMAEELLNQTVAAAKEINSDERYAKGVRKLAVFGSFLGDSPLLNDLDTACELECRWESGHGAGREAAVGRMFEAWPPPRSAGYFDRLMWPEIVIKRHLKVSRRVSVVDFDDIEALGCPYRMLIP